MAKNSTSDRRSAAREKARQIAQAQAKREKTAKTVLYGGIGVVVVAVIAIVVVLLVQAAKPQASPNTYVSGGVTLVESGSGLEAVAPKDPKGDVPAGLPSYDTAELPSNAANIDVYLDFQCPLCKNFEDLNGDAVANLVKSKKASVTYHPISILDAQSGGNRYSTRAANLASCVADSGQADKFVDFIKAMFANQPEEQSGGLDDNAMLAIAQKGGIDVNAKVSGEDGKTVTNCVNDETFSKNVEKSTQDALSDGLQGTPRILVNGKEVDAQVWGDKNTFATELLKATGDIKG